MNSLLRLASLALLLLGGNAARAQNLVRNGTFAAYPAIGAEPIGPNTPIAPAPNDWQSGVPYAGTAAYPADTRVAIQVGSVNYAAGIVVQNPFPGDAARGVPPSDTWLYANGNDTNAPYTIWRQTVAVQPNTAYAFSCYTSNAIATNRNEDVDPMLRFRVNGANVGEAFRVYDDADPLSGHNAQDLWDLRVVTFTTGPDATTAVLELRSEATGAAGDDLALTAIALRENRPLVLTAFDAVPHVFDADLTWATASEGNSTQFDVERSLDNQQFARLATVPGQSRQGARYAYRDANAADVASVLYYRLRYVAADGAARYSEVRTVRFESAERVTLYPNPVRARPTVMLDLTGLPSGLHTVVMYDLVGRPLGTWRLAGRQEHRLPTARLPLGTYVVRVAGRALCLVKDD